MYAIESISSIERQVLDRVVPGYTSSYMLQVTRAFDGVNASFAMTLVELSQPFTKRHDYSSPSILESYHEVLQQGFSYGAFVDELLVGLVIGEVQRWNSTLVIREFGVAPDFRNRGIGSALMETAHAGCKAKGLRGVLCETQSTNVPAIRLYLKLGFHISGLDTALYSNEDIEAEEVAVFLRKAVV